ncbi:glycosyltransferase family 2 protein [Solilutibacter silvestris]|uniref:Glycosyl transferase family 2 n=1 Tax=Solilutibacter silvestris TaxID=1645665 RepID=A0A2K1Q2M1_9GAMM|nr:glycosyltransferase family A protein [Lysobacter silvestris]PNS09300.1 Glycosyl transferase family 2 [Lysobacter silvestris]
MATESDIDGSGEQDLPLVSIGLFAYNEARFLRRTLDSLLAQDYANIEIIISDNCSTDETEAICLEYAQRSSWIRYHRRPHNVGSAANSIHVLEQATGKYFMWASGHDAWSPGLISTCVTLLEGHPSSALAYGPASWIDEEDRAWDKESGWYDTRGMQAMLRFFMAFWGNAHPILGLIRTRYLHELPKIHACVGADQIVLVELALKGDFLHAADAMWWRRQPRKRESHADRIRRYKSSDFGLAKSWLDRSLPLLRLPLEQARAVLRSQLGIGEKIAVLMALVPAFLVRYLAGRKA